MLWLERAFLEHGGGGGFFLSTEFEKLIVACVP